MMAHRKMFSLFLRSSPYGSNRPKGCSGSEVLIWMLSHTTSPSSWYHLLSLSHPHQELNFPFVAAEWSRSERHLHSLSGSIGIEKICILCLVWWGNQGSSHQVFVIIPFSWPLNGLCLVSVWETHFWKGEVVRPRGKHLPVKMLGTFALMFTV